MLNFQSASRHKVLGRFKPWHAMAISWLCLLILPASDSSVDSSARWWGLGLCCALQADRLSESVPWNEASELLWMFRLSIISEPLQGPCWYPLPPELNWEHESSPLLGTLRVHASAPKGFKLMPSLIGAGFGWCTVIQVQPFESFWYLLTIGSSTYVCQIYRYSLWILWNLMRITG